MSLSGEWPDITRPPLGVYEGNDCESNTSRHGTQLKMIHITSRNNFSDEKVEHVEEREHGKAEEEQRATFLAVGEVVVQNN